MGNHKLNLSYIIPKSWLFNLKPTKKHHRKPPPPLPPSPPQLQPCPPAATTTQSQNYSRKSYYFTRELTPTTTTSPPQPLDPSRKSSTRRRTINTHRAHCRKAEHTPPESSSSTTTTITGSSVYGDDDSSSVRAQFSSDNEHEDIVINVDYMSLGGQKNETHLGLKEIKTKENSNGSKLSKEPKKNLNSPGVRLRVNSPRIGRRGMAASGGRRSVSGSGRRSVSAESFAVVKASYDPVRDFRESMEEMIMEKNIRGSKDMEDLLACYLLLNSDEYHDLIIKVFKQIWFDFSKIKQS